jgi:enterochelin esterase-like enzyme
VAYGQEGGEVVRADFFSETLNRTYQYIVYLPAGYDESEQSYPTAYLLHGRGDTMEAWLNVRSQLDRMIAEGEIPPLIAIMPDMPSSDRASYYVDSQYESAILRAEAVETAFFADLVPHIDATYRTLPARESRVIGGYSMGGYGAIRYALAHADVFSAALVLSPAVYTPLPPVDSSAREFGAFGVGDTPFDEAIYASLTYPALLPAFAESGRSLALFVAVGDDEWKNPNPEDYLHDIDMEAHLLFNRAVRVPGINAELRIYDGGHDWLVWERGFVDGMTFIGRTLATG